MKATVAVAVLALTLAGCGVSTQQEVQMGAEYAQQNLPKQDPFSVERMNKTDGQILRRRHAK